jgi:hypothetical protein
MGGSQKTDNARRKHQQRKHDREKHLDRLYAEQNSLCHWCKSQCVLLRYIQPEQIVCQRNACVVWEDGEFTFEAHVATIDHVDPIRDSGRDGSRADNLVMACSSCNGRRTQTPSPKPDVIRRVCPDCLGEKPARFSRCKACQVKQRIDWLLANGWEKVDTNNGQCKFRDPQTGELHIMRIACETLAARKDASRANWRY